MREGKKLGRGGKYLEQGGKILIYSGKRKSRRNIRVKGVYQSLKGAAFYMARLFTWRIQLRGVYMMLATPIQDKIVHLFTDIFLGYSNLTTSYR